MPQKMSGFIVQALNIYVAYVSERVWTRPEPKAESRSRVIDRESGGSCWRCSLIWSDLSLSFWRTSLTRGSLTFHVLVARDLFHSDGTRADRRITHITYTVTQRIFRSCKQNLFANRYHQCSNGSVWLVSPPTTTEIQPETPVARPADPFHSAHTPRFAEISRWKWKHCFFRCFCFFFGARSVINIPF